MKKTVGTKYRKRANALGRRRQGVTVCIIALVVVIVLGSTYWIMDMTERRAHTAAEKLVSDVVDHIDRKLDEVREATLAAAEEARPILNDPDGLIVLVQDFVGRNGFVYGSTVAFEPYAFPGRGRCFAPYSWSTPEGDVFSRQLGTETDYYEEEWYAETKRTGDNYWCEPYFDEGGAKVMMCTFSVPLMNEDGTLRAVMTSDVSLEELQTYVASISPYPDSYIILRSAKGSALANADMDSTVGSGMTIIKGLTKNGWAVELMIPFTYLTHGDTGVFFFVGIILLFTILVVVLLTRLVVRLQQRSNAEYIRVIDAIASHYSSIFLIDLETEETDILRQPSAYMDVVAPPGKEKATFFEMTSRLVDYDCYVPDRPRLREEITAEAMRTKLAGQDRYQVRFRKESDSDTRWYEMHVYIVERGKDGAPLRAVAAFTDVNEGVLKEEKTQETLKQALEMAESANRAKTSFLFSMSHDIRTPLNAILGFTSIAKKHIDDRAKVSDCLDKTQQSGNLLLALINSVLEVSRIESGHTELREDVADIQYSFTAIQDTMTDLAAAKDITITFTVGDIRNRYVYCDLDRCNRIFVNIISNAVKYTAEGGYVRVRCEQIADTREGYGNYRYSFEDNGIGMSEEFQKKIFDYFTREETSTVSGIQGSGLGMAVCKSFVDLMGGTIDLVSKPGVGTTFTVTLPFRLQGGTQYIDPFTREEHDAAEKLLPNRQAVFAGRRVLLAEDNELNREIAEEILGEEGLLVETAENGKIAVEKVRQNGPDHYDFILMDIQMPVMDGYEATKRIRAMYPDRRIPIIALSANAFAEDKAGSFAAGMDDHVAKPINIKELFSALGRYI